MKWVPAVLLPVLLLAANPAAPPRRVEEALRSRVNEFYTLLTQHKSRAAEALVAQDTRDYYYDSQKPDIASYEIGNIVWGPGFRTAEITIHARMNMMFPGVGPQVTAMKFPSTWKLENGKWCWYVDKARIADSPFGTFHAGPGSAADFKPIVTPGMLAAGVRASQNQVMLYVNTGAPAKLTFTNSLPGPATLQAPDVPGLKIEIPKPQMAAGQSTEVILRYDGAGSQQRTVTFTVLPTNQKIPIQVLFAVQNK